MNSWKINFLAEKDNKKEKNEYSICTDSIGEKEGTTKISKWSEDAKKRYDRCLKHINPKKHGKPNKESQVLKRMDHDEYQKSLKYKSDNELRYIIQDAKEALKSIPDNPNAGYYQDEIHYASMELNKRKKNKLSSYSINLCKVAQNEIEPSDPYQEDLNKLEKLIQKYNYIVSRKPNNYLISKKVMDEIKEVSSKLPREACSRAASRR